LTDESPVVHSSSTRFRARSRWRSLPLPLLAALFVASRWWWGVRHEPPPLPPLLEEGEYHVEHAIDGDTLQLAGDVRIRLLGVDTPETVQQDHPVEPWGSEASEFTKGFVAAGPVRLTFDRERRDRYGRQLAFVWRGDVLLNERLIAEGFSKAQTKYPYSPAMKDRFRAAEREARNKKLGLWSVPKSSPAPITLAPVTAAAR
jgi:endonuclease YncB( thermonuclease family)